MVTKNFRNRKPLNAEPVDSHKNRSLARSSQARTMTMPTTASWIDPQKFSEPKVLNGDSLDRGRLLLACSENPFRHYIVAGTIFFLTHDLLEEGAPLRQRRTLRIGVDVFSACDKPVLRSRWQAVSAPTRRDRPPPQTLSHKQKTRQGFGSGFGRSHGYTIGQTRRHCTTRGDNGWANGL